MGAGDFAGHFSILLEPITKAFSKFAKSLLVLGFRLPFLLVGPVKEIFQTAKIKDNMRKHLALTHKSAEEKLQCPMCEANPMHRLKPYRYQTYGFG